jgi:hypothetical protein
VWIRETSGHGFGGSASRFFFFQVAALARIIHDPVVDTTPFAEKTVGAGRSSRTKNAAQASAEPVFGARGVVSRSAFVNNPG